MTTTDARPTILIIDDEPQTVQALADARRARGEYEIEVHEPDDVAITEDLLRDSALILVDFQLKRWARATAPRRPSYHGQKRASFALYGLFAPR